MIDAINQFLDHLQAKNASPHTVGAYRRDLEALLEFCARKAISAWSDLDVRHARQYGADLHRSGLSPRSVRRMLSAGRSFYKYLIRKRAAKYNAFTGIRGPKPKKVLPQNLNVEQAVKLVTVAGSDFIRLRDRAMLEFFYSSGLRVAELASLDVQSIDLDEGDVRVIGKGNKMRQVPIGSHACKALELWLKERTHYATNDALFISRSGRRVGVRMIQYRVQECGRRQIASKVYPRMLRHSFATHILESSGDLRAVQELLGHKHLSTTQVYTHLDADHLMRTYSKNHPRAARQPTAPENVLSFPIKTENKP